MGDPRVLEERTHRALHRWSVALVVCTFLLILAGGLVTSRDAGLAVPDWPLSYGTLNPPRWYAIENVRTEHGHRLVAGTVAVLTMLTAWRIRRDERRRAVRRLAAATVVAVLLQALLGGLRVLHLSIDLAMVHGWLAQVFFSLVVSLAVVTSPHWKALGASSAPRQLAAPALATVVVVAVQLVVGIFIRHAGPAARPLADNLLFYIHVMGAALILTGAVWMSSALERESASLHLISRARLLVGLTLAQIALGLAAWVTTEATSVGRAAGLLESWIPTFHVALGATVLACSVTIALHAVAAMGATATSQLHVRAAGVGR